MVEEVKAFKTAMGKLCDTREEAENEEIQELEAAFVIEAGHFFYPNKCRPSDGIEDILKKIFRDQIKFKEILDKYSI